MILYLSHDRKIQIGCCRDLISDHHHGKFMRCYLKVTWKMSPFDLEASHICLIVLMWVFINLMTYTGPWQQNLKFGGY